MGISGWIHSARDLRHEGAALAAMTRASATDPAGGGSVQLSRPAGFAWSGTDTGYAESRHPAPRDDGAAEVMVAIDGRLAHRDHLQHRLGHPRTPRISDADLLLHAYRRWGPQMVEQLDGRYAIGVYDGSHHQVLLICDRIGVKTWYYHATVDGGLLFATSVRALLAHREVTAAVDVSGLNELLTMGPVRTPGHGVIRGVSALPAGHLARGEPTRIRVCPYWQWRAERHGDDLETTAQVTRRTLADTTLALREHPVGAVLLSGGIASAAVAAFTTPPPSREPRPTAYTLSLAGPWTRPLHAGVDTTAAARTAAHLRLRSTMVTPTADTLLDAAMATREILDLPGASPTDAPRLALLRAIPTGTAVVTGDGARAVFGGYPWLTHPDVLASDTFPWLPGESGPVGLLSVEARLHLLPAAYIKQRYADATAAVPYAAGEDATGRAHRRAAYLTLTHYLPAQMRRIDQLAAAAGLTVHTPAAAWPLAQYLFTVPYPVRHLTDITVGLLRHTVADLLPASVTWRPGFPPPGAHLLPAWRRSQHQQLRRLLDDPAQPLQPLLDRARIRDLLDQAPDQVPCGGHTSIAHLLDVNSWLSRHHIRLT